MRIKTKKLFILILSLCLCLVILTSCMDLADVEDEEEYYAIFGKIYSIKGDSSDSYSMLDFYNKESVENMKSPLSRDKYNYIVIKSSITYYMDEIAMYIKTDVDTNVAINMYKLDAMPSVPSDAKNPYLDTFVGSNKAGKDITLRLYEEDDKNLVQFSQGEQSGNASFTYNEDKTKVEFVVTLGARPVGFEAYVDYLGLHVTNTTMDETYVLYSTSSGNKLGTVSVAGVTDTWTSFMITKFNYDGKANQNLLKITDDDYIVFEILNNDASASLYNLKNVNLEATNILIRIKKDKE